MMASNIGSYYLNSPCRLCDLCPHKDLILDKNFEEDEVKYSVYCSNYEICEYVFEHVNNTVGNFMKGEMI